MAINPVQRIRDAKRYFKPQQKITFEEWEQISRRAAEGQAFFKSEMYQVLLGTLNDSQDIILENRLREVQEEHIVTESFKKVFITPKKIQDDEIIGQFKFIRSFLAEVKTWVDFKKELEEKEAQGTISIERSKDVIQ